MRTIGRISRLRRSKIGVTSSGNDPVANIAFGTPSGATVGVYGNATTGATSRTWSASFGVNEPWDFFEGHMAFGGNWTGDDPATNTVDVDPGDLDFTNAPLGGFEIALTAMNASGNDTATAYVRHDNLGGLGHSLTVSFTQGNAITEDVTGTASSGSPNSVQVDSIGQPANANSSAIYLVGAGNASFATMTTDVSSISFDSVPAGTYDVYAYGIGDGRNGPRSMLASGVVVSDPE